MTDTPDMLTLPGVTTLSLQEMMEAAPRLSLAYLATPYTKRARNSKGGFDLVDSSEAAADACRAVAALAQAGVTGLSPVVLAHSACVVSLFWQRPLDPLDAEFWHCWCAPILLACEAVIVPSIPGCLASEGIAREVHIAAGQGKPVFVMTTPLNEDWRGQA